MYMPDVGVMEDTPSTLGSANVKIEVMVVIRNYGAMGKG